MTEKRLHKSSMPNALPHITLSIGLSLGLQHAPAVETPDLPSHTPDDEFFFQHILAQKVARLHCLAEGGEINAQYELGLLYRDGFDVEQDASKAFYWLEKAAFGGHVDATYALAMLYAEYDDSDKALHWIGIAAKHGHNRAEHVYKYMLTNDFGYGC